jgi:hypothetical protein
MGRSSPARLEKKKIDFTKQGRWRKTMWRVTMYLRKYKMDEVALTANFSRHWFEAVANDRQPATMTGNQ